MLVVARAMRGEEDVILRGPRLAMPCAIPLRTQCEWLREGRKAKLEVAKNQVGRPLSKQRPPACHSRCSDCPRDNLHTTCISTTWKADLIILARKYL